MVQRDAGAERSATIRQSRIGITSRLEGPINRLLEKGQSEEGDFSSVLKHLNRQHAPSFVDWQEIFAPRPSAYMLYERKISGTVVLICLLKNLSPTSGMFVKTPSTPRA